MKHKLIVGTRLTLSVKFMSDRSCRSLTKKMLNVLKFNVILRQAQDDIWFWIIVRLSSIEAWRKRCWMFWNLMSSFDRLRMTFGFELLSGWACRSLTENILNVLKFNVILRQAQDDIWFWIMSGWPCRSLTKKVFKILKCLNVNQ